MATLKDTTDLGQNLPNPSWAGRVGGRRSMTLRTLEAMMFKLNVMRLAAPAPQILTDYVYEPWTKVLAYPSIGPYRSPPT